MSVRRNEFSLTPPKPSTKPGRVMPFKDALMRLIEYHGKVKAVGQKKPVSNGTQKWREDNLFLAFRQLKEMGFKFASPDQLREYHVRRLVEKWEEDGLSASTLQNRLSVLRSFAGWIGKNGMVRDLDKYLKEPANGKRTAIAVKDKSWSTNGIDVEALFVQIGATDENVAMQLRLMLAFGLRREEAICLKPHRDERKGYLVVRDGTKGGRERTVEISNPMQRAVLDAAKAMVKRALGYVGNPELTLKQSIRRFQYVMWKHGVTNSGLGITAHGLRHERLNDRFEELAGIPSPVRMSIQNEEGAKQILNADPARVELARAKVSEEAGHVRLSITGAYTGSHAKAKKSALDWSIPKPVEPDAQKVVTDGARLGELFAKSERTEAEDAELNMLKQKFGVSVAPPSAVWQPTIGSVACEKVRQF